MRRGAFILILALCLAVAAFAQSAVQFLPVPANMTFGALVSVSRYGTFVLGSATDGNGVTHYLLWGPNLGAAPQDLSKAAGPTPASPVPYDGVFTAVNDKSRTVVYDPSTSTWAIYDHLSHGFLNTIPQVSGYTIIAAPVLNNTEHVGGTLQANGNGNEVPFIFDNDTGQTKQVFVQSGSTLGDFGATFDLSSESLLVGEGPMGGWTYGGPTQPVWVTPPIVYSGDIAKPTSPGHPQVATAASTSRLKPAFKPDASLGQGPVAGIAMYQSVADTILGYDGGVAGAFVYNGQWYAAGRYGYLYNQDVPPAWSTTDTVVVWLDNADTFYADDATTGAFVENGNPVNPFANWPDPSGSAFAVFNVDQNGALFGTYQSGGKTIPYASYPATTNGTLTGYILDVDGSPLTGPANVSAFDSFGNTWQGRVANDGFYAISVPAGNYSIQATGELYQAGTAGPIAVSAAASATLNLNLNPGNPNISGSVTNIYNGLLDGATITVLQGTTVVATTTTGLLQGFGAPGYDVAVAPGTYTVQASLTGYVTQSQTVTVSLRGGNATASFQLLPPSAVGGKVTDSVTGQPIPNATVTINNGSGTIASGMTQSDGSYNIVVGAGTYTAIFSDPSYIQGSQSFTAYSYGTTPLNEQLVPGSTISGRIYSATTLQPLPNVQVLLYLPTSPSPINSAMTAADGTYQVTGATAGTYVIGFVVQHFNPDSKGVHVNAGQTATVNDVLNQTGQLNVLVQTSSLAPLFNATVSLYQNGSLVASSFNDIDVNGGTSYEDGQIISGNYTVKVSAPGYMTAEVDNVFVDAGANQSITATLSLTPPPPLPPNGTLHVYASDSIVFPIIPGIITVDAGGMQIGVHSIPGTNTPSFNQNFSTDSTGNCYVNLPPGQYEFNYFTSAGWSSNVYFSISSNNTTAYSIEEVYGFETNITTGYYPID